MKPLLMGMLGAAVMLLLVAAAAWWWFRRKLRRLADGLGEIIAGHSMTVPPFRVSLRTDGEPEWSDAGLLDRVTAELEGQGYARMGDFVVSELNEMPLRGFAHQGAGTLAVLYENPGDDSLVADVIAFLDDDIHITISNAPDTGVERPPFAPLQRMAARLDSDPRGVVEMHQQIVRESSGRPLDGIGAERFVGDFTTAWARVMDWHVERGGVTPEEVRQAASLGGQPVPDDTVVESIRGLWRAAIREFVEARIRDRFLRTGTMSAADWEAKRDRVRFIHERTDLPELIESLAWSIVEKDSHLEDDEDDDLEDAADTAHLESARESLRETFAGVTIRDGFRKAQPLLPENMQWRYVCKVAGEHPADVYITPEDADAYEDDDE